MNSFKISLFQINHILNVIFFMLFSIILLGQASTSNTIDTLAIKTLSNSVKALMQNEKWEEALIKLDSALTKTELLMGIKNETYVNLLHEKGRCLMLKEDYDQASLSALEALEIKEKIYGLQHQSIAATFKLLGLINDSKGDNKEAIKSYEKAINIYLIDSIQNKLEMASLYSLIGFCNYAIREYEKAIVCLEKSLQIKSEMLGDKHGDVAKSFRSIGVIYQELGNFEKAIHCYYESLNIYLKDSIQNGIKIASSYNDIGTIYYDTGEYDKALIAFQKSLGINLALWGKEHPDVADNYSNMGLIYIKKADFENASRFLENSLTIRLENLGEENKDVAASYVNLGLLSDEKGDYLKAIHTYEKAINIYLKLGKKNILELAATYQNVGASYYYYGDIDKSLLFFEKVLNIQIKLLPENHLEFGGLYQNLGAIAHEKGDFYKAIEYHEKGLDIYNKNLLVDHPIVAAIYNSLGGCYSDIANHDQAIECYGKSLKINLKKSEYTSVLNVMLFNNMGREYSIKGDYKMAVHYLENALQIASRIKDIDPNLVNSIYSNIGVQYMNSGDYGKAIEYCKKSLYNGKKNLKAGHTDIALAYINIGAIYDEMKDYYLAIQNYKEALEILKEDNQYIVTLYNNLGNSYSNVGENEKALFFKEKALNLKIKLFGEEHPDVADSYHNLGLSYEELKDSAKAINYFEKALQLRLKAFGLNHPSVAINYIAFGNFYKKIKNFFLAKKYYEKGLQALRYENPDSLQSVMSIPKLLTNLKEYASMYQDWYMKERIVDYLNKSLALFDNSLKVLDHQYKTISEYSKKNLASRETGIYEGGLKTIFELINKNKDENYNEKVFEYLEKSKSLLLFQAMQETKALSFSDIPDTLIKKENDLKSKLIILEKQRQKNIEEGKMEADSVMFFLNETTFRLNREYEKIKSILELNFPLYYRIKYDLSVVNLEEVQHKLLEPNQTLLEYFVGDSTIFLMLIRPDLYKVFEIPRNFALDSLVEQMRTGLYGDQKKGLGSFSDASISKYKDAAQVLYKKLLEPAQPWLSERLVVVPDGVLGYIPFESLLTAVPKDEYNFQTYPYLSNKYQISYSYSATLLKEMQEKQRSKPTKKIVLAMAPFYQKNYQHLENQFGDVLRSSGLNTIADSIAGIGKKIEFKSLDATGEEAIKISKLWKGDYYLNKDATENHFSAIASDYRIIHLSTHGVADYRSGDYSYLAFADVPDTIENELLYVRDLYNLQINADLVILSACETGVGELQRGEGIISLARAFAYAGAKSMVTSLWVSNDGSTKELMVEFHKQLKNGLSKDEALWRAKQEYIKKQKGEKSHPFYWAGFIGIGDMKPINLN